MDSHRVYSDRVYTEQADVKNPAVNDDTGMRRS